MKEAKIINFLRQEFPVSGGIGDDAAIFAINHVISKDLLIEDIHFRRKYFDSKNLAHKALQVNLSDMAAMGAKPIYVLLGIAIPKNSEKYIDDFLVNFAKACKMNDVKLIGGDTTASPDKLFISVTIIGIATSPKQRNTANVGDIVCVVGNLGYAHIGLQAFEAEIPGLDEFKEFFLAPKAALKEGRWLASHSAVTAMMDISDGLLVDLRKLCSAANVAGEINVDNLATTKEYLSACHQLELDPLSVQLAGGEDYGLLITVKSELYEKLYSEFLNSFAYPLKNIGKITAGNRGEVTFNKNIEIKEKIFSHFGEL